MRAWPAALLALAALGAGRAAGLEASVRVNAAGGAAPFALQAVATATTPVNVTWDFGDGSPLARGPRVSHRYARPGVFALRTRVRAAGGSSVLLVQRVRVTGNPAAAAKPAARPAPRSATPKPAPKPASGSAARPPAVASSPPGLSQAERDAIALVNRARASGYDCETGKPGGAPRPALVPHPKLRAAALGHSRDMLERGYFAHESPDGDGPKDRVKAAGYAFSRAGENIVGGMRLGASAASAVDWWLHSRVHCENIMNAAYAQVGVGLVHDPKDPAGLVNYWTLVLGAPSR